MSFGMHAIINNFPVEISREMMTSNFLKQWVEFPTANGIIQFDTEYFDEFLLLNLSIRVQPGYFHTLELFQLCRLVDAMEYFGDYGSFYNIKRAFRKIFWPMSTAELLEYRDLMKERYYSSVFYFYIGFLNIKLKRMSFEELAELANEFATQPINDTNRAIRKCLYHCIFQASKAHVVETIENAIYAFIARSRRSYWPSVSWCGLYRSGLSRRFIAANRQRYIEYYEFFASVDPEDFDNFCNCPSKPLYLGDLPIKRYMHNLALSLVPHCNVSKEITSIHPSSHWNDYGIDYSKFSFVRPAQPIAQVIAQPPEITGAALYQAVRANLRRTQA
jgi:hypothetical protein